jgi:hypothetical protein
MSAARPLRKKNKPDGSQTLKRKTWRESEAEDIENMTAAQSLAVKFREDFLSLILAYSDRCAISGLGQSWCFTQAIGPALQPCQIIPQNHYHLYSATPQIWEPIFGGDPNAGAPQVWAQSWSAPNGILLMSHLREAFELRLVSIHPETLCIRAFVPYDVIMQYDGQKGIVPENVDRGALRHHYDMCCIENMAALMPIVEQV